MDSVVSSVPTHLKTSTVVRVGRREVLASGSDVYVERHGVHKQRSQRSPVHGSPKWLKLLTQVPAK